MLFTAVNNSSETKGTRHVLGCYHLNVFYFELSG